jgi:phage terminase large subunit
MIAEIESIVIEDAGKFRILYELPPDINVVVCIGGRGGRKTYEVSKFIAKSAAIDKKRCIILRDEKELIRESILNDILNRYDAANEYGHLSLSTERLDTGIKDRETGEMLVFTKGFRASDTKKRSNLKGSSNIDIAVIEEAEDIRDVDKFNTFHDSLRKKGSVVIIILNTPDVNHWIIKRYFNLEQAYDKSGLKLDGYFKIVPKVLPGFMCIQCSYRDNPYLPEHVIRRYEAYGDPMSNEYNPHYSYTAIEGYASTGRKGQILTKVKSLKLAEYMALPFKEVYGQDFGTSSPAGLVGVKFDKNNCYCRQINCLPMDTVSIGKKYCELKLGDSDKIVADSAEPKTIERLKSGWRKDELPPETFNLYPRLNKGFHVVPAIKGIGSIKAGIGLMISMNLFAVEESKDLWNEIFNWVYATDKNEQQTDEPLDDFNHLIDPWRYVITEHKGIPKKLQTGYFR